MVTADNPRYVESLGHAARRDGRMAAAIAAGAVPAVGLRWDQQF
jgi:hypothetical protein